MANIAINITGSGNPRQVSVALRHVSMLIKELTPDELDGWEYEDPILCTKIVECEEEIEEE